MSVRPCRAPARPTVRRPPLILASRSAARGAMLRAAGVPFEAMPAPVDEAAVKAGMLGEGAGPRDIADALAELKARRVARRVPGRWWSAPTRC